MNHEAAVSNAKDIADRVLAPAARQNDKEARFSSEAVKALGTAGLLGIMLPADVGGSALGPRIRSGRRHACRSGCVSPDGLSDARLRHRGDRCCAQWLRCRADA